MNNKIKTELESTLEADADGVVLNILLKRLDNKIRELACSQRKPCTAGEYSGFERQRMACIAAMRILGQQWEKYHVRKM